jgi:hypothetical protein
MGVKSSVEVDGRNIPMVPFMKDFISGTIVGMIESLQEVNPQWKLIELTIDRRNGTKTVIKIDKELITVDEFVYGSVGSIAISLIGTLKDVKPGTRLHEATHIVKWDIAEIRVER